MNKLRKKLVTETETIEAYASNCQSTCYYNCSGPCNAHQSASFEATTNSAYYYMYS
jgi:putative bacteriocin precursor